MAEQRRAREEGRLRFHRHFASRFLSTPRDLVVYVPPGYGPAARYPVFYLQDGQNLFDPATAFGGQDWRADVTADKLICQSAIEPLILVGIYNTGVRRVSEYTPTRDRRLRKGGKADRYAQMLAREIKPLIDHEYRTKKGAEHTAVGGSSLGALASLVAGLAYQRVFGQLAVLSPSVWWDGGSILSFVRSHRSRTRPRIWLDVGTEEGDKPQEIVRDARLLRDTLTETGWRAGCDLEYREIQGAGHHETAWGARFGDVLRYLFASQRN
ncbi:MAG TPA: alpha/beta hydrolase-fold protein [Bryobacteraceae bacterium]|nr:alpha/beta hydrolase-fold protein [Bryobacteraceae bacterium]